MIEFVLYVFLAVGILETAADVGTKTYDIVSTTVQEVLADEEPDVYDEVYTTEQQD